MVLLGGLEFVAAGYIINELHKDGKAADSKDDRRDHRKPHHHRRDSRHRPSHASQLRPPSDGPQRPLSAPPPASRPMWQQGPVPPMPYHQNQNQNQSQFYGQRPGPPPPQPMQHQYQQQQHPGPAPQQMYHQQNQQQQPPTMHHPQQQNIYPPPGQYIDLKTGKIQTNMYPPDMQPGAGAGPTSRGLSLDDVSTRSENPQRTQSTSSDSAYGPQQFNTNPLRPQMTRSQVSSPPLGYAELDSETPGRYRPYGLERDFKSPPPPYRE